MSLMGVLWQLLVGLVVVTAAVDLFAAAVIYRRLRNPARRSR